MGKHTHRRRRNERSQVRGSTCYSPWPVGRCLPAHRRLSLCCFVIPKSDTDGSLASSNSSFFTRSSFFATKQDETPNRVGRAAHSRTNRQTDRQTSGCPGHSDADDGNGFPHLKTVSIVACVRACPIYEYVLGRGTRFGQIRANSFNPQGIECIHSITVEK